MDRCELRALLGHDDVRCGRDGCPYWRVVEHLDLVREEPGAGCALQYFGLLEGGEEMAGWLLTVKERVEQAVVD